MTTPPAPYAARYTAQAKLFKLLGDAFQIFGPDGSLAFYVKQKAFAMREKLTVYRDAAQSQPVLRIAARQVMDFSTTYDVEDISGEKVGAARRKGLKSLFRDEWSVLDAEDREVGLVVETGGLLSILRRLLDLLRFLPQSYSVVIGGREQVVVRQRFHLLRLRYEVETVGEEIDPRMVVGLVVLLLAIEGKRDG